MDRKEELVEYLYQATEIDLIEAKLAQFKELDHPTAEQLAEYNKLHLKQLRLDTEYHEYAKKTDEFQLKELEQD